MKLWNRGMYHLYFQNSLNNVLFIKCHLSCFNHLTPRTLKRHTSPQIITSKLHTSNPTSPSPISSTITCIKKIPRQIPYTCISFLTTRTNITPIQTRLKDVTHYIFIKGDSKMRRKIKGYHKEIYSHGVTITPLCTTPYVSNTTISNTKIKFYLDIIKAYQFY